MEDKNQIVSLIRKIISENPIQTGVTISYYPNKTFNVYEFPINILSFNPYNDRIASYIKEEEFLNEENINWNTDEGQAKISEFLWKANFEYNKKTQKDLEEKYQQIFGIIDLNGIVIDGNRRLCILRKICEERTDDLNIRHFKKFKAIVIEEKLSKQEIMELETVIQMGQDEKVDYEPIEKYLKVNKFLENDISLKKIAKLMKLTEKQVSKYKEIYDLMTQYLNYINAPNQFQFIREKEDHFIQLSTTLKSMKDRKYQANWKFGDIDIFDFQNIAFSYIRSNYEGKHFRKLLGSLKTKNNIFSNIDIWKEFSKDIFDINSKFQKTMIHRKDLKNKDEIEDFYETKTNKVFRDSLDLKVRSLDILNERFHITELMKECWEIINSINEQFHSEKSAVTPEFKSNFNKVKNIVFELENKMATKK